EPVGKRHHHRKKEDCRDTFESCERECNHAEAGGKEVEREYGGALRALRLEQSMMHVQAVRTEDLAVSTQAAQDREPGIHDRNRKREERHDEGEERGLGIALDGNEREDVAYEEGTRIAKENPRRRKVEGKEAEERAYERYAHENAHRLTNLPANESECRADYCCDPRREAIKPVDEIQSIGDTDDPERRDAPREPVGHEPHRPREWIRDLIDPEAIVDCDSSSDELHRKLRGRVQTEAVIKGTYTDEQKTAEEQSLEMPADGQSAREQHTRGEANKQSQSNRDPPEERDVLAAVYLPLVGAVDHPERAGDPRYDGRRQRRNDPCCDEGN